MYLLKLLPLKNIYRRKEQNARNAPPTALMEITTLDDDGTSISGRAPPPVQPALRPMSKRQTQPSVSIEQAAKPSFDISVGDPPGVGD